MTFYTAIETKTKQLWPTAFKDRNSLVRELDESGLEPADYRIEALTLPDAKRINRDQLQELLFTLSQTLPETDTAVSLLADELAAEIAVKLPATWTMTMMPIFNNEHNKA